MAGRKSISFKTRKNQTVNLPIRLVELRMKQLKKKNKDSNEIKINHTTAFVTAKDN